MRYDNYGNYSDYGNDNYGARMRDSRGRYMGNDNYGRNNYGGRYRGHNMLDDMSETYGTYMMSKESGRYGSPESTKSFDYMLKSAKDFFGHLFDEASSQEEVEKIRKTAREISEM